MKKTFKIMQNLFVCFFVLILTACATPPSDPEALKLYNEANDPLEPYNRVMTDFNFKINRYIYRPFDKAYQFVFPKPVRDCVSNASSNLSQPYYFVNALLQAEFKDSAQIFARFFTNTTLGIGGLFDVASQLEIQAPVKDFGETLYRWGWNNSMPYFVWPFLGPSDIRETVASVAGFFLDPTDYVLPKAEKDHLLIFRYALKGINTIDSLSGLLEDIERTSIDPYVALRTMYRQNRSKFLNLDDIDAQTQSYDIDFEFEEDI
ncbi:MAG: VacJ family lipoprotein [Alphaproteobacteria bacterium]|nr:VacJ family lipoprotein [Alphaproteobacteria bacterium]